MGSKSESQEAVTSLLVSAEAGGEEVWDQLVPLVYEELRAMAHAQLAREGGEATLDTTDLVHEAYLRLVDGNRVVGKGRGYFFGAAARAMREVLVDRARRRRRDKRGGGQRPVTLEPDRIPGEVRRYDLLGLDRAVDRLAEVYPRAARVVECRFFAGLGTEETAEALQLSPRTVKRDWALARAWLYRELDDSGAMGSE